MEPRFERSRVASPGIPAPAGRMGEDVMLALGSLVAGAGLFMTGLLALLFRHPNAPRWTRPEIVAMLICVPVTVTTGFGLGHLALGLTRVVQGTEDPRELLVLAGVVIALAMAWYASGMGRRLNDYAAANPSAGARLEAVPVVDETPPGASRASPPEIR
jgi:hypothetical protein